MSWTIPEEFIAEVMSQNVLLNTRQVNHSVGLTEVDLTPEEAATLAYVSNLPEDTVLQIRLRVKPV